MTFEVVRVVQEREDEGLIIASGFETEADAIRCASRKDQEYGLQHREYRYPFTYHTTRVSTGVVSTDEVVDSDYSDKVLQDWGLSYERAKLEGLI